MSVKCILQGQKDKSNVFAITATLESDGETITADKTPAEAMAAAQDGKLVIMYLDGTPFIAKQVTSNYIEFYGDKEDNVLYITGIDNTWDGLTKKGVSYFPYESSGDGDLHTFVELGGENAYKWAASQELRNYLQLYTKSEI